MDADYSAASPKIKFHFMWHGRRNFSISMTRLKCGMSQLAKNSIYINGECFTNSVIRQ